MYTTAPEFALVFTDHALEQMNARRLSVADAELVWEHGRHVFARDAVYCFVGKKEVAAHADLAPVEGIHLVVSRDAVVITAYRNREFRPHLYRKPSRALARKRQARRRRAARS